MTAARVARRPSAAVSLAAAISTLAPIRAATAEAPSADADRIESVEAPELVSAAWIADRGALDLGAALALSPAGALAPRDVPGGLLLDGYGGRAWLISIDGTPLFSLDRGDSLATEVGLPLFVGEHLALQPGPQPDLPGALAGAVDLHAAPVPGAAAARAAVEGRGGGHSGRRAALAAGATAGRTRADVAVFAADQAGTAASQGVARHAGLRSRLSMSLGPRASLGLRTHLLSAEGAGGSLAQRQLLGFDASLFVLPRQELRLRTDRQAVEEVGGAAGDGVASGAETRFEASYHGELVVDHRVDCGLHAQVGEARFAAGTAASREIGALAVGLSARDVWRVRENLQLMGGAGLAVDDGAGTLGSGRIALRYTPTPLLALRGAVGSAQRARSLEERAGVGRPRSPGWSAGTEGLRAERSQGLRLSAGLEPTAEHYLRVAWFRTDLTDLLTPSEDDPTRYRNLDRAHAQGLRIDARAALLPGGLGLRAGYQWLLEARDDRSGRNLPGRPAHTAQLRLTWDLAALGTHVYVDTELLAAAPLEGSGNPSAQALTSMGLRQRLRDAVELSLALDNATDARGAAAWPWPGRTLRAGVQVLTGVW